MVFKSLNDLAPTYLSNIISRKSIRDTVYLRYSETDLQIPLFKTANGQNSFAYVGAQLWNSLESEVKKALSVLAFKHRFYYFSFPTLIFCYFSCVIKAFTFIIYFLLYSTL